MIVLDNDESGAQTEAHQKRMMGEIAKLTAGSNGALDAGGLRAHGGDAAGGRLGSGDLQGAGGGLDPCGDRQGAAIGALQQGRAGISARPMPSL